MSSLRGRTSNSRNFTTYTDKENYFLVDSRYEIVRVLGKGSYGVVCSAVDTKSRGSGLESKVAIKKITKIFHREVLLVRAIRELKFMKFFKGHKNVCTIAMIVKRDTKKQTNKETDP